MAFCTSSLRVRFLQKKPIFIAAIFLNNQTWGSVLPPGLDLFFSSLSDSDKKSIRSTHFFDEKMEKQPSPAKDWCFTINNPRKKDWNKIWQLPYQYLAFQVELGAEGTPHFQGFVQLQEKLRLSAVKKYHRKAHWEKRRGTPYEASHYCMKPVEGCKCKHCDGLERFDESFEDGYMTAELHATMNAAAKYIMEFGLQKAIERFPSVYLMHPRGMESLATRSCPLRDFESQVTVLFGASGLGKTRYALESSPTPYKLATFGEGTDFFGGYDPLYNQTLVVDDFYSNWKYTTFLQVCDRYPTEVHTKGGYLQLLARDIVFTSNLSPDEWYPNVLLQPERRGSFFRRIHNIIHFTPAGYIVTKGHLPFPAAEWMNEAEAVLGNVAQFPITDEFRAQRSEWYSAHRQ